MNTKNIVRIILLIALFVGMDWGIYSLYTNKAVAFGLAYYIDAEFGSDANSGTSPELAWQSLFKINSQTFQGGDSILFKRGNEWRGGFTLKSSSNYETPVTISAYGTGANPILNGSEIIAGSWSPYNDIDIPHLIGAPIFVASTPLPVFQVIVDGQKLELARYPDTGYFKIDQVLSENSFISAEADDLLINFGVRKNKLTIRSADWRADRRNIVAYDSVTKIITFDLPLPAGYTLKPGMRYYISNSLPTLTRAGEWYYDESSQNLYIWMPADDSPANHVVEVSTYAYGLLSSSPASITASDIDFKNYAKTAIVSQNNTVSTITDISVNNSNETGIYIASTNSTISNSVISNSNNYGILASGTGTITITGNTLTDNGRLATQVNPGQSLSSIRVANVGTATISFNTITGSGYAGVDIGKVNVSTTVDSNAIDRYCLELTDCGGIYVNGSSNATATPIYISSNTVKNGFISTEGYSRGIYLDWYLNSATVQGNIIENPGFRGGVFVNGGDNNRIENNTIRQTGSWQTIGFAKWPDTRFTPPAIYPMNNNLIQNNIFIVEEVFNDNYNITFINKADSDPNFGTVGQNSINTNLVTTITTPSDGTTVSGIVPISAQTSGLAPITKVEFYIDNILLSTDTVGPYSTSWDTTVYGKDTLHTIIAKTYDHYNIVESASITVTVLDITPPTISITSPANNSFVTRNKTTIITANSSDVSGITKVEFYVKNILKCTDTTTPYTCNWSVPAPKGVAYKLNAKAYDAASNIGTSSEVNVTSK